jgi:hypothetical protein
MPANKPTKKSAKKRPKSTTAKESSTGLPIEEFGPGFGVIMGWPFPIPRKPSSEPTRPKKPPGRS